jgi:hypothetical protein
MVDWRIDALTFGSCNCDYGCPCQFELRPTHGNCTGFEVGRIERGHFGDTRLDGLHWAVLYAWPGPIFEGDGAMQAVIDERANDAQRAALPRRSRQWDVAGDGRHYPPSRRHVRPVQPHPAHRQRRRADARVNGCVCGIGR